MLWSVKFSIRIHQKTISKFLANVKIDSELLNDDKLIAQMKLQETRASSKRYSQNKYDEST